MVIDVRQEGTNHVGWHVTYGCPLSLLGLEHSAIFILQGTAFGPK